MKKRLNLDGPVPCRYCGGAFTWVEQEREPGEPSRWSGRCACGCGHDDAPEVPTWRVWARGDQRVAALVQELGDRSWALRIAELRVDALDEDAAQLGAHVRALLALVYEGVLVASAEHADRADHVVELLEELEELEGYVGFDAEGTA